MNQIIRDLGDDDAVRIFTTIVKHHFSDQEPEVVPTGELIGALADQLGVEPGHVGDGDVARQALEMLAGDDELNARIGDMAEAPPMRFMPGLGEIALVTAVVMLLKSRIDLERDKKGQWRFRFKSDPLDKEIFAPLAKKLPSWIPLGPNG